MNKLKEPTEQAKRDIELKVNDICQGVIEKTLRVDVEERAKKMVDSFKTALMTELSKAWVREQELKEQVDNLKKQIK